MGPILGAGLISGIGSLMSSIFGAGTSAKNMREQNKFNAEQAEIDRQWRESMWNKENEYNTPSAQLARLREAGLSPGLMYQNGGSFAQASIPSGSQARAAESQRVYFDPGQAIQMALQAMNLKAQTDESKQRTATGKAQEELYKAETEGKNIENYINEGSKDSQVLAQMYETDYKQLLVKAQEQTNIKLTHEASKAFYDYQTAVTNFGYLIQEKELNIEKVRTEIDNMNKYYNEQIKLMQSQEYKNYCDALAAKAQAVYYKSAADRNLVEMVPGALKMLGEYRDKCEHARLLANQGKTEESKRLLMIAQETYFSQMESYLRSRTTGQNTENDRSMNKYTLELLNGPIDFIKNVLNPFK